MLDFAKFDEMNLNKPFFSATHRSDRFFSPLVVDDLTDPVEIIRDARVNAGNAGLAATDAPGNHPGQLPAAVMLADHRTAAVALASVFALLAAGADEARMQIEAGPKPRPSHLLFADVIANHRYVHLVQYVLILAVVAEGVLAPAGGPTPVVHHDSLLDLNEDIPLRLFIKILVRKDDICHYCHV